MKVTKMRDNQGKIINAQTLRDIELTLSQKLSKAGFITDVRIQSRSSIKLGLHMKSFILDLNIHDKNLQNRPHGGGRLTNLPTWDQRVDFNDIVNAVLNEFEISANVTSGPYTIRKGFECFVENDWHDQKPDWIQSNESRGWYIESVDVEDFLEERRERRNREAREKRQAKRVEERRAKMAVVS